MTFCLPKTSIYTSTHIPHLLLTLKSISKSSDVFDQISQGKVWPNFALSLELSTYLFLPSPCCSSSPGMYEQCQSAWYKKVWRSDRFFLQIFVWYIFEKQVFLNDFSGFVIYSIFENCFLAESFLRQSFIDLFFYKVLQCIFLSIFYTVFYGVFLSSCILN